MRRSVLLATLGLGAAFGLDGCANNEQFAPACPSLSMLRDASDLTRYQGSGLDLSDLALSARITAVPANCKTASPGKVAATLKVAVEATHGPAAPTRTAKIPFFVAVTEGDRVLDEQDYSLEAKFPPNLDTVQLRSREVTLLLPVSKDKSAAAYHVFVGFRLTPEELAFNRQQSAK